MGIRLTILHLAIDLHCLALMLKICYCIYCKEEILGFPSRYMEINLPLPNLPS